MHKHSNIICIGAGDALSDSTANAQAAKFKVRYNGILDASTVVTDGCYHTSIYDIKLPELQSKISSDTLVIVLDIPKQQWTNADDYYATINMAQSLDCTVEFINPNIANPFVQLVQDEKHFCIMPFIALYKKNDGVKTCCYMKAIVSDSYTDFKTDAGLSKFRDMTMANKPISNCSRCYQIEEYGGISPRQTLTIDWAQKLNVKAKQDIVTNLVYYDARLSNQCNLMCRSCEPKDSHLIDREFYSLGISKKSYGLLESTDYDIVNLDTIQHFYVAGGEPTISKDFCRFLQKCIDLGKTDFEMVINTNAMITNNNFVELVSHFSNVKFEISVDGFDSNNYYIRWPANWKKLTTNIDILNKISNNRVSFNTVVSIYNMGRLYDLFKFLEDTYPTAICHISLLLGPDYLQAKLFPNKEFALADLQRITTLKNYAKDAVFKSGVDSLIELMTRTQVDTALLQKFFDFNDKLDSSRGVTLNDYIPELEKCRELITKQT